MFFKDLQPALRRAGQNPTESEVQVMINKIDDGSASLAFTDFCALIREKTKEVDPETHFKDTFRVFSKDQEGIDAKGKKLQTSCLLFGTGCIPAEEMKFVLLNLPGRGDCVEVEEMINTVDRNGDGKISFSEFRYCDIIRGCYIVNGG